MTEMGAHFSEAGLKFLRALKRNNDREWFAARKPIYESEIKTPMLAVISEVNEAMLAFAPEHVRDPGKTIMRIYRDIRFSPDKRPYKTHVSAWWSRAGLEKTSGGGFYFQVSGTEVTIAAGVYMPEREQLLAIRRTIEQRHEEFRALLSEKALRRAMQAIESLPLTRTPKGFPAGGPADDLIRCRQWGVSASLGADQALQTDLVQQIVRRFRLASALVAFLNQPLVSSGKRSFFQEIPER